MTRAAVWRDARFARLWAGAVVSSVGSQVTTLALPLTAVQLLAATPAQMGILGASDTAAFLVFGLAAGVVADRSRRRSVLLFTSLASALVVASVPFANAFGRLHVEQLYVVAFVAGSLALLDQVAFQALLPRLVGRDRVLETVTLVRSGDSVTAIAGPTIGGFLVQVFTAPVAIVVDAASFVVQTILTLAVRVDEPAAPPRDAGTRVWHEVMEGLRYVFSEPSLRGLAFGGATHNFFSNGALVALYVLFMTTLGLSPAQIGIAFAAGGPAALLGSAVAGRYGRRFGMRDTLVHTQLLTGLARAFVPLAALSPSPLVAFVAGEFILGIARSIANVNQLSMRLALTPDHLQGRMTASVRFLMWSVVPFGALAGGFAAQRFGLVPTLTAAVIGTTLASLPYLLIPPNER